MKNKKRRIEPLSFFDHTGISRHLEKMAEKGWYPATKADQQQISAVKQKFSAQ